MLPSGHLVALLAVCKARGTWLLADEAHRDLVDADTAKLCPSMLAVLVQGGGARANGKAGARDWMEERVVVVGDLSYAVGVGGWGVAHAVVCGGAAGAVEEVLGGVRGGLAGLSSQMLMLAALR